MNEEVATGTRETGLSDEIAEKVIAREVKKRKESITLYHDNDRDDLAENEQKELEVLERYLPQQLSEDEVRELATQVITETGASSPQQMGQVIGGVKAKAGNAADGALVAKIVKELLS